jgi:3-oxoacyl-[acyl-carrier-protein] synthase III
MRVTRAGFLGTGSYLPGRILTNQELEKTIGASDGWITARTGIRERRVAADLEYTSDLAAQAAQKALNSASMDASEIDQVIVATITPDTLTPSTACLVQAKLGAYQAAAFDISAACSGFLYGLALAKAMVEANVSRYVLLVGADKLSAFTDWRDPKSCVLFGDGAGAAIIGVVDERHEILSLFLGANGCDASLMVIPGGGSKAPASEESLQQRLHYLRIEGRQVFKIAVKAMSDATLEAVKRAGLQMEEIAWLIPHQANDRILRAVAERLQISPESVYTNIDRYGNTSAASVIIALDEGIKSEKIRCGQYVALTAFGAGSTVASAVIRW